METRVPSSAAQGGTATLERTPVSTSWQRAHACGPSSDYPSAQLMKILLSGGPNERAISIVPFTSKDPKRDAVRPVAFVNVLSPASVAPRFVQVWLTVPEKYSVCAPAHSAPLNVMDPPFPGIMIVS